MDKVKVRKVKKDGALLVRDTDGTEITLFFGQEYEMNRNFFEKALGLSLLKTNELELVDPVVVNSIREPKPPVQVQQELSEQKTELETQFCEDKVEPTEEISVEQQSEPIASQTEDQNNHSTEKKLFDKKRKK